MIRLIRSKKKRLPFQITMAPRRSKLMTMAVVRRIPTFNCKDSMKTTAFGPWSNLTVLSAKQDFSGHCCRWFLYPTTLTLLQSSQHNKHHSQQQLQHHCNSTTYVSKVAVCCRAAVPNSRTISCSYSIIFYYYCTAGPSQ